MHVFILRGMNFNSMKLNLKNLSFLLFQLELENNIRSIEELSKSVSQEQSTDSDGGSVSLIHIFHSRPMFLLALDYDGG